METMDRSQPALRFVAGGTSARSRKRGTTQPKRFGRWGGRFEIALSGARFTEADRKDCTIKPGNGRKAKPDPRVQRVPPRGRQRPGCVARRPVHGGRLDT